MNTNIISMADNNGYSTENNRDGFPDIKKLSTGLLFIIAVSALLIWTGVMLMDPDTLPIRNVRIEGEFRQLSPETLQTIVADVVKGGFFNVNVESIQDALLHNPWVHHVTVRRIWPDGLSVQVTEQIAVAHWGDQGLINSDAGFFSPQKHTYPENLPVFSGPENTYSLLLNRYVQIRGALEKSNLILSGLTLNERWAWSFRLEQGPRVFLGRRNVTSRVERFATVVVPGIGNRLNQIEVVDMRYTNGFAVQWRTDSSVNIELGQKNHG